MEKHTFGLTIELGLYHAAEHISVVFIDLEVAWRQKKKSYARLIRPTGFNWLFVLNLSVPLIEMPQWWRTREDQDDGK